MRIQELKREIVVPQDTEVKIHERTLSAKGPKGENQKYFTYPRINISIHGNKVILSVKNATKKDKTMIGTMEAHINNLIEGVKQGFIYKLKVCSGHFPMNVSVKGDTVLISNFMGEKVPRKAKVLPHVNVKVEGDVITLNGLDIENVSQSAANIELATRRSGFDKRVFQDGCYIIEKAGKSLR